VRLSRLWRNLTRKDHVEAQLDAELRSYVDLLTEEKVQRGIDRQTAYREALIDFGGVEQVKESVRDVRAGRLMEQIYSDLRHAWRTILKMPLTAAVVVLSLGVGIGANVAVFSWIQAVVFSPLPGVSSSGTLQLVEPRSETGSYPGLSWPEYLNLRDSLSSFPDLLAFRMVPFSVGERGSTERIYGLLVSGNYFSALGLRPALGRFIQLEEAARPGGAPIVVISYDFWQTHFGSSPAALGQTIRVNDQPLTIVGVAPVRFQGTVLAMNFGFWTPATMAPFLVGGSTELADRSQRGYEAVGRLRSNATRADAQAELTGAMRQLAQLYPETNANVQGEVMSFWQAPRGPQRLLASSLAILQTLMLLLLLAVCGNAANLMLTRTSLRQREIGVRLALGAGPGRVVSLLLTENLFLAFLGVALGFVIAVWGTQALRAVPMIEAFPIRIQTGVDTVGLGFAMLLGLACGLIFGAPQALALARLDPQSALRGTPGTLFRSGLRNTVMGTQIALALMVLVAAGLLFRSFRETQDTDPGFRRDGVLLAGYDLNARNVDASSTRVFAGRLLDRLRALPEVEAAAIAVSVPLDIHGMPQIPVTVEGHARASTTANQALTNTVTPGYFATLRIPFRAGRDFADLDNPAALSEAIVNEEFVRRYLEASEPLGRHVTARGRDYAIVGVVANSVYESVGEAATPMIYRSYRDRPASGGQIHVRTSPGREMLLAATLRRTVRELDLTADVYDVRTMNEHVGKNAFLRRIPARMFVVLGPLLLALASIGIYAVVACSVAQRTTEIGVRLALGATARRVTGQIVRETLRVVCGGALIGWLLALLVDIHLARGVIYLPVFIGVPLVLLLVATVACWLPARRAGQIDPIVALRQD
jgi:predicted permease